LDLIGDEVHENKQRLVMDSLSPTGMSLSPMISPKDAAQGT
jgi:hypothetical protein